MQMDEHFMKLISIENIESLKSTNGCFRNTNVHVLTFMKVKRVRDQGLSPYRHRRTNG